MRRNVIALILAAAMLIMTACGGQQSAASAATSEAAQTETNEKRVLRVGMECNYAPHNWQENDPTDTNIPIDNVEGAYAEGYDVQIARMIADHMDCEVVAVKLAWDGLIEALNNEQIDMIIAGMADTETRKQSVAFSNTYKPSKYVILVDGDGAYADATRLEDFSGAAIIGQKDTKYDEVIDQIPGVNHLTPVEAVPNMIERLVNETCDGVVIGRESADAYIQTNPQLSYVEFEEGFDLGMTGSCVGLRLDDTETLELVNEAIAPLTQEDIDRMIAEATAKMPQ